MQGQGPRYGQEQQLSPHVCMFHGGSTGHWDQYDPDSGHRPWISKWPQMVAQNRASLWPLVATLVMDINTGLGYSKTKDPDIVLGSNPSPDVTLVPAVKQAAHINPFLTILTSLDLPLTTAHKPPLFLSHFFIIYLLIIMAHTLLCWEGLLMLSAAWTVRPQAGPQVRVYFCL